MSTKEIEICTAKPNLAPDFIQWMNSAHKNSESKINHSEFLEPFVNGEFDPSCKESSIPLNIKLRVKNGGWLEKLIALNRLNISQLDIDPIRET